MCVQSSGTKYPTIELKPVALCTPVLPLEGMALPLWEQVYNFGHLTHRWKSWQEDFGPVSTDASIVGLGRLGYSCFVII